MPRGTSNTLAKKAAAPAKRKMLTPAERIAKAEADLAAIKAKAAADSGKKAAKVDEKLKSLVAKRDKLNEQIAALEVEKAGLVPADAADDSDS